MTMLDDLRDLVARLNDLPPQPIRVRVTAALGAHIAHVSRREVHQLPMLPTYAFKLPVIVDLTLPAHPGFELDYPPERVTPE